MIAIDLSSNPAIKKMRKEILPSEISQFFGIKECQNVQTP
jgi:hypothetical protein